MNVATYRILFSINLRHEFFSEAGLLNMSCIATSNTRTLLQNMEVIFRPVSTGYSFFYDTDKFPDKADLCTLFNDEYLTFIFYPKNVADFYNYTDGIVSRDDGVLLFLADQAEVNSEGIIDTGFGEFTRFKNRKSYPTDEEIDDSQQASEDSIFTSDDIRGLKSVNKDCIPVVFKISTNTLRSYQQYDAYQINFKSLKSYYKYYLSHDFAYKQLQLRDVSKNNDTQKIKFRRLNEKSDTDHRKFSEIFISTRSIALRYKKRRHFQLLSVSEGSERVILDFLPLPKVGNYYKEQIDGHTVIVSEVFIN